MISLDSDQNKFYDQTFCEEDYAQQHISNKEFEGCHFQSCDFSDTTFLNCEFTQCTFTGCNLSLLNVTNSRFLEVEFVDCKVMGVDWIKANWRGVALGDPLKFTRCMINSSSFNGLHLPKIVIEECRAHDVDFREANFSGANFCGTDLSNSLFHHTNLAGADLNGAENYDININNNIIENATFCRFEAVRLLEPLGINLVG